MIARRPIDRLGYRGIEEVLDHPWLALSPKYEALFNEKGLISPFLPGDIELNYGSKMSELEPSED